MNNKEKGKYIGIIGAFVVHVAFIALLFWIGIIIPEPEEESGVPVLLGNIDFAQGSFDPESLSADYSEAQDVAVSEAIEVEEQHLITQDEEQTIPMEEQSEAPKPVEAKPQPTEAEIAAEKRRLAEEKAAREKKAAADAAAKRVSGAFGKGSSMGSKGESRQGTGVEGVVTGSHDTGKKEGIGGYGNFDLSGRSIGPEGLHRPIYNVQDEGVVVINILVNPEGQVINTTVNLSKTNTANPSLRKAAEDAAKKARFNSVSGVNNQSGTITYQFNLK